MKSSAMTGMKTSTLGFILLFSMVVVLVSQCEALTCPEKCDKSLCREPIGCKYGFSGDGCGCCRRCAKGLGETCAGLWYRSGWCATGLVCEGGSETNPKPGKCVAATKPKN